MDNSPINIFSGTIPTLSRSLDLRARNHELIINNVANADTPNYKPFKMDVDAAMQKKTQPGRPARLQRTDDQHLAGSATAEDLHPDIQKGGNDPLLLRGDQNGVDIDVEMTALAKNSLLYRASTQIVAAKFSGLKKAITGGTK